ncbi:MAG: glutamyl-tRNA reductase [Acidobacteriota bacterium]|nr:glutamyl-tRNA reductase [Acidobacteriota bacterium]
MEPTLAVIGLNFRTSTVAVRERFWISEARRSEALYQLVRSEGIDEAMVLATCNRTEFILWTSDVASAADSVLRFLAHAYELRLCEWSHFYRLMDDIALAHIFRVASSLDSMVLGEHEIMTQVDEAWKHAKQAGSTGRFLDSIVQKALSVSKRVRSEVAITDEAVSMPYAIVELSIQELGDLTGREVLLIGAGQMSERAARCLMSAGARKVNITSRTSATAEELATRLNARRIPFEERHRYLETADIVVSSTQSPNYIISREQAEAVAHAREHRPLVLIDLAVPRDIDPAVREIKGIRLFDIDDLEQAVRRNTGERHAAAAAAEKIICAEVSGFRHRLAAEQSLPEFAALRRYLDELCRQELELLRKEFGPFTADQDQVMTAFASHVMQRIASSLARELYGAPKPDDPNALGTAVSRLMGFEHLQIATEAKN